ncbi:unnamed protein product [Ixodes hexagonus]
MELFAILESSDVHDGEEIKQLVNQSLANNKDPSLLNELVEYYLSTRSQRCLDVLVAIREPNNKYLFDKLVDSLKGKMRLDTLKLITNIVHKQPSWLHCITSHKILSQILGIIKGDPEPTHIMLANVIVISLMPMLPMQFGTSVLLETFEAFSSLAALCTKKPSHIHDTHLAYLRLGLQTLFQHLYGMYPCNFLAYLRGYYGSQDHSRENFSIYTKTIRPLLQRTRLHPLLVTASKEAELSPSRWRKTQTYDILVECARHTVDSRERMPEAEAPSPPPVPVSVPELNSVSPLPLSQPPATYFPKGDHAVFSSTAVSPCWSPIEACGLAKPRQSGAREFPRTLAHEKSFESQEGSLPLDLAVEATPEDISTQVCALKHECTECAPEETFNVSRKKEQIARHSRRLCVALIPAGATGEKEDQPATLAPTTGLPGETPFFSTTNNLTAEPHNSLSELPEYQEEQQLGSQREVASLAHSLNRLRYYSQCPMSCCGMGRPPLGRSRSCPRLPGSVAQAAGGGGDTASCPEPKSSLFELPPQQEPCHASGDCGSGDDGARKVVQAPEDSYGALLSLSLAPFLPQQRLGEAPSSSSSSYVALSEMSSGELLEKHLQVISDTYISRMHASGKGASSTAHPQPSGGPQADELHCLRGQVCLLYAQLLYERHRKDVHIERNRRLLAKAKKILALEEQTSAYKDQLVLLEMEIKQHQEHMEKAASAAKQEKENLEATVTVLGSRISELKMMNASLVQENIAMKEQVRVMEIKLAEIKKEVEGNAATLLETKLELETAQNHASISRSYERQVGALQRELVTLGEMYKRLEARLSAMSPQRRLDKEVALVQEAARVETAGTRHILDVKSAHLEALSSRVKQLEGDLSNKDVQIAELKQLLEHVGVCHQEQMQSKEGHISMLTSMCQRMEAQLIELRPDQKRESCSEASAGFDEVCATMEMDGNSPTVDPSGLLGSYSSTTEMTPVSDMLREAEQAAELPKLQHDPEMSELEDVTDDVPYDEGSELSATGGEREEF